MFVKTSHPGADNGWCWVPVLSPLMLTLTWPPHLTMVSPDAITGILFTSATGSKYRNMRRVICDNKLGEKSDCDEGLYTHIQKILYEKSCFMIPGSNTLWERFCWKPGAEVSEWTAGIRMTVTKKGTWTLELKGICWMRGGCLELSHY